MYLEDFVSPSFLSNFISANSDKSRLAVLSATLYFVAYSEPINFPLSLKNNKALKGYFTNTDLSANEVYKQYRDLWVIERAYRVFVSLKTQLFLW